MMWTVKKAKMMTVVKDLTWKVILCCPGGMLLSLYISAFNKLTLHCKEAKMINYKDGKKDILRRREGRPRREFPWGKSQ